MMGMDMTTGAATQGIAHLRQSMVDILRTPLDSRVMLRDYGSRLFELTDAPMNRGGVLDVIVATADALKKWESRLQVSTVTVQHATADGRFTIGVSGVYTPNGKAVSLDGLVL